MITIIILLTAFSVGFKSREILSESACASIDEAIEAVLNHGPRLAMELYQKVAVLAVDLWKGKQSQPPTNFEKDPMQ